MSSPVPCQPCLPVAPYQGGKRNLAKAIIERIAKVPHTTYCEPFVGMGGVFLRRGHRAPVEVINDLSADVATLFRILQRHYVALMDMLRWQVTSRAEFERLVAAAPDTLTDLERAARFLYLQRLSWGGKVEGRSFGVDPRSPGRFDVSKLASILEAVHSRLAGVVIERLPYGELLARYDRPASLFYLDPPYFGCEGDYGPGFTRADFALLADQLVRLKGKFLLSLNDTPEVRAIFKGRRIAVVTTSYSIAGTAAGRGVRREVIIS
jgi:DNA adenine methylase